MRLIVRETNLDNLDVGTLFIVTCQGGTIGREGEHSVLIPDKNISKVIIFLYCNAYFVSILIIRI